MSQRHMGSEMLSDMVVTHDVLWWHCSPMAVLAIQAAIVKPRSFGSLNEDLR